MRIDNMGQNFVSSRKAEAQTVSNAEKYHSGDDHVAISWTASSRGANRRHRSKFGHRGATICHLGNIAIQLKANSNGILKAERFVGDKSDEANAHVKPRVARLAGRHKPDEAN